MGKQGGLRELKNKDKSSIDKNRETVGVPDREKMKIDGQAINILVNLRDGVIKEYKNRRQCRPTKQTERAPLPS